jgi:hypothetical protein
MRRSRVARNAYVHQQMLAARAVTRMQQRLGVQPGERLKWCAPSQQIAAAECTLPPNMRSRMLLDLLQLAYEAYARASSSWPGVLRCALHRLRPPDDSRIYAVLEEGGLGGSDWNQWTRQAVSAVAATSVQYHLQMTASAQHWRCSWTKLTFTAFTVGQVTNRVVLVLQVTVKCAGLHQVWAARQAAMAQSPAF